MYTPAWNKAMNDGTLLGWPSAVWAPGVLAGIAPSTKGKWAMAPLPEWDAGETATGYWGGSSTGVTAKSKHHAAAAQFASWLNTDPAAARLSPRSSGVYPASTRRRRRRADRAAGLLAEPDRLLRRRRQDRRARRAVHLGPGRQRRLRAYSDAFGKATQNKSPLSSTALDACSTPTVADMKKTGFTV